MAQVERVWSEQQQAIFNEIKTGHRNVVVDALAGTGKTTTIIKALEFAPEDKILLCAFNKRIAEELTSRLTNRNARAQTLHSIGFGCVKRYWSDVKVQNSDVPVKRADLLAQAVCPPQAPDSYKKLVAKLHTLAREINPHAEWMGDLTDLMERFECEPDEEWCQTPWNAEGVERAALAAMELAAAVKPVNGIDFADMIFLPVRNRWVNKQFDLVCVDEAQDMTVAQLELAQGVCRGRMVIVGDKNQAIYGFRGADSGSMDRLAKELDAVRYGLTVTYRCGRCIVEEAQRLVPAFEAGPQNGQGSIGFLTADKLTAEAQLGDFILSRLNAPLVDVAMTLLRSGKRTRVAGRDIGSGLIALVRKFKARSVPEFMSRLTTWEAQQVARFEAAKKFERIDKVRDQADMLRSLADDAKSIQAVTDRIEALFTDDGLGQAGVITCSSVHRAKGLEASRVFILRSTLYPRGWTQEEANIEYVAITRAKDFLVWVTPSIPQTEQEKNK